MSGMENLRMGKVENHVANICRTHVLGVQHNFGEYAGHLVSVSGIFLLPKFPQSTNLMLKLKNLMQTCSKFIYMQMKDRTSLSPMNNYLL